MKLALQAANGLYVCAENGGDDRGIVHANRPVIGEWETWDLARVDGGVTFQSASGRYLSAELGGGGAVHANRVKVGPWEIFVPVNGGFRCCDERHWLCADLGLPDVPLVADRLAQGPWETFTQIHLDQPAVSPVTREEVCGVRLTFQGLWVDTQQYGRLPWFEPALLWLNAADRQAAYAAKHAAGDTHCILGLPSGPPLYDEPNQPYSRDRFGPLDWTHGGTTIEPQFLDLVSEVLAEGFHILLFLGGDDGERGYPIAVKQLPMVAHALGALANRCLIIPGWDGVFFGWTPEHIDAFGRQFRALLPDGYLGIEHSTGHIPVGNGPSDYAAGGPMQAYDVILSEFDRFPATDAVWQVAARLLGPAYRRPSDQPHGDDPTPPFYLKGGTPRGPYFTCAFEWVGEYDFVRGRTTDEKIANERAYFKSLGYVYTG